MNINIINIYETMAKNTGKGYRNGVIKERSQTYNPKTGHYVKRNHTGQFIASKSTPFKGVRREKNIKN